MNHKKALENSGIGDKFNLSSPQQLIHYCIHYAGEHNEGDMQVLMDNILRLERQKSYEKVYHVLMEKLKNSDHREEFTNEVMQELQK